MIEVPGAAKFQPRAMVEMWAGVHSPAALQSIDRTGSERRHYRAAATRLRPDFQPFWRRQPLVEHLVPGPASRRQPRMAAQHPQGQEQPAGACWFGRGSPEPQSWAGVPKQAPARTAETHLLQPVVVQLACRFGGWARPASAQAALQHLLRRPGRPAVLQARQRFSATAWRLHWAVRISANRMRVALALLVPQLRRVALPAQRHSALVTAQRISLQSDPTPPSRKRLAGQSPTATEVRRERRQPPLDVRRWTGQDSQACSDGYSIRLRRPRSRPEDRLATIRSRPSWAASQKGRTPPIRSDMTLADMAQARCRSTPRRRSLGPRSMAVWQRWFRPAPQSRIYAEAYRHVAQTRPSPG